MGDVVQVSLTDPVTQIFQNYNYKQTFNVPYSANENPLLLLFLRCLF